MSFKILVVDDNINNTGEDISALPPLLEKAGFEVVTTADGAAAYDLVWECNPDLIVLDIDLGILDINGIDLCQAIRSGGSNIPIIFITAVARETDQVLRGFEAGADDYVILPLDLREVLARIRANLPPQVIVIGNHIQIDFITRRVWVKREDEWHEIHFQRLQFELLKLLVTNAGRTLSTTTIIDHIWGKDVSTDALGVYIHRLREKLELAPSQPPAYIENIRGLGYRFNGRLMRVSQSAMDREHFRE